MEFLGKFGIPLKYTFLFLLNDWKITVSSICFFTLPGVPKFLAEISSSFYLQWEMKWNSPLPLFSLTNKYTLYTEYFVNGVMCLKLNPKMLL